MCKAKKESLPPHVSRVQRDCHISCVVRPEHIRTEADKRLVDPDRRCLDRAHW